MTEHIVSDHPGQIEIYTTDPHEPFVRFKSTRKEFALLTESVCWKGVLNKTIRGTAGDTTVHIFPEHVTAITFNPVKENSNE